MTSNTERLGSDGEDAVVQTNHRDLVKHKNDFVDDCGGQLDASLSFALPQRMCSIAIQGSQTQELSSRILRSLKVYLLFAP
jgi:hypothetical protein